MLIPWATSATFDECARTGGTEEQYGQIFDNPAGHYNYMQGGNPQLRPETSETKSVGFVWRPHWDNDFDFSVDYFDIDVEDAVGIVDPEFALEQCLSTGAAENYLDLTAQFMVAEGGRFSVGVNNLFDNDAPLIANRVSDNGNTFPSYYDALGRYFFAGFEYKF